MKTNSHYTLRLRDSNYEVREEQGEYIIEGFFAVFGQPYIIDTTMREYIDVGAFDDAVSGDVRALINHDTTFVVGRTKANTLELEIREQGLWGRIHINPADQSAMDAYARVKRGDVDQCSIGFDIEDEERIFNDDGTVEFHIKKIYPLYEVSICTFPAYEDTSISARSRDIEKINRERLNFWKEQTRGKLRKGKNDNGN